MANFTGENICDTYTSILNIRNGECILPNSDRVIITDSAGNASSLSIGRSNSGILVTGAIDAGNICSTGNMHASTLNIDGLACVNSLIVDTSINGDNLTISNGLTASNGCFTGDLQVSGEIKSLGDITAFYTSDSRLKTNLNTICNTQSIINSLTGYSFQWNAASGKTGKDFGLMAQDVCNVLPDIVITRNNGYLAVDYIKLIPVLIEEVKRLNAEIQDIKN